MTTYNAKTVGKYSFVVSITDSDDVPVADFYDENAYGVFVNGIKGEDRLTVDGKRMIGPMEWLVELDEVA